MDPDIARILVAAGVSALDPLLLLGWLAAGVYFRDWLVAVIAAIGWALLMTGVVVVMDLRYGPWNAPMNHIVTGRILAAIVVAGLAYLVARKVRQRRAR